MSTEAGTAMEEGLPQGWAWATPIQVGQAVLGKMLDRKKHRFGRSLPYLRNINVRWGKIDLDDLFEMFFEDHELDRYGLEDGDLLICEGGEPGRCAVWNRGKTNLKFQKALHRLRVNPGVNPYFLMYQIQLDAKTGNLERFFTGSTIKHFTGQSLAKYCFKLAPSREQQRIVDKVDELFSQIEAGEQALARVGKLLRSEVTGFQSTALRQSILRAAFSGKLVPQDPADEPASVLLERIREDRAGARRSKRGRPRRGLSGSDRNAGAQLELLR